jgi:hypothetical protein
MKSIIKEIILVIMRACVIRGESLKQPYGIRLETIGYAEGALAYILAVFVLFLLTVLCVWAANPGGGGIFQYIQTHPKLVILTEPSRRLISDVWNGQLSLRNLWNSIKFPIELGYGTAYAITYKLASYMFPDAGMLSINMACVPMALSAGAMITGGYMGLILGFITKNPYFSLLSGTMIGSLLTFGINACMFLICSKELDLYAVSSPLAEVA